MVFVFILIVGQEVVVLVVLVVVLVVVVRSSSSNSRSPTTGTSTSSSSIINIYVPHIAPTPFVDALCVLLCFFALGCNFASLASLIYASYLPIR